MRSWRAPIADVSTLIGLGAYPVGAYALQYEEAGYKTVSKKFVVVR